MEVKKIQSFDELINNLKTDQKNYVFFYKSGSEQSECAYRELNSVSGEISEIDIYSVDVSAVRDIHEHFGVGSVPTMLELEGKTVKNQIKGCHDSRYFKAILEDAVYISRTKGGEGTQKRVVVYSTPSCTWCNTLKSYLREHKIRYTDIDVSRDESAAREMVQRSGQQGVPQTDINGQMIVGFDKVRINKLLGING